MKTLLKKIIVYIITEEAKLILKKYKPKVIAITGSVGKTSTKDAVYSVLSHFFFVRKSEKSFNSEIGVPLTIIGAKNGWNNPILWLKNILSGLFQIVFKIHYPRWLVLEVGADRPGDIEKIATWLKPDTVIITKFAPVPAHVEFFASARAVIEEKSQLVKKMNPEGVLVLNSDDEDVLAIRELFRGNYKTFGITGIADVSASNESIVYENKNKLSVPSGMSFKINYKGASLPATIPGSLGRQHIYPILASICVGLSEDLPFLQMVEAANKHIGPNGRMKIISGEKNTVIIDDTYNSSPVAAAEALELLKSIDGVKRKIAVLGDMMELGKYSVDAHKDLGRGVAKIANILIAVGIRARDIANGAILEGMSKENIFQYDTSLEASDPIETMIQEGDIILVKGSQSMRMEKIVESIMADPENKDNLLVRQDDEWQIR